MLDAAATRTQVIAATETLYLDAKNGFAGTGLKKDGEPIDKCSMLDDIISFTQVASATGRPIPPCSGAAVIPIQPPSRIAA